METLHPILKKAHTYRIIKFVYECSAKNFLEHTLELHLTDGNIIRRLQFIAPQNLMIEKGFPLSTHGMEILDVSSHQLEDIKISVKDFESNYGAITFDALAVLDLDDALHPSS